MTIISLHNQVKCHDDPFHEFWQNIVNIALTKATKGKSKAEKERGRSGKGKKEKGGKAKINNTAMAP